MYFVYNVCGNVYCGICVFVNMVYVRVGLWMILFVWFVCVSDSLCFVVCVCVIV